LGVVGVLLLLRADGLGVLELLLGVDGAVLLKLGLGRAAQQAHLVGVQAGVGQVPQVVLQHLQGVLGVPRVGQLAGLLLGVQLLVAHLLELDLAQVLNLLEVVGLPAGVGVADVGARPAAVVGGRARRRVGLGDRRRQAARLHLGAEHHL